MGLGGEKHQQGIAVFVQDFKAILTALPFVLPLDSARGPLFLKRILGQAEGDGLLADAVGVALAASDRAFANAAFGPMLGSLDQFFLASPVKPAPAVWTMASISPG